MSWQGHNVMQSVGDASGKFGGGGYHTGHGSPGGLAAKLANKPGVRNPGALAGAIERRIRTHQSGSPMRMG